MVLWIPFLWVILLHPWKEGPNLFTPLENWTIDWRFRFRGERAAPVKIFYLNVDSESLLMLGDRPWNLDYFADVTQIVLKLGQAKAIGYDFVFSSRSLSSQLIDLKKATEGAINFGAMVIAFNPQVILGAEYTDVRMEYMQDGNLGRWGRFPLLSDSHYHPSVNPYPEVPSYPIIGPNWGRLGLLESTSSWNDGAVPRWVPLFAEFKGGSDSLSILEGMRNVDGLPADAIKIGVSDFILQDTTGKEIARLPKVVERTFYSFALELFLAANGLDNQAITRNYEELAVWNHQGQAIARIPLTNGQLLGVNWFSRWDSPAYNPSAGVEDLYRHFHNYQLGAGRGYEEAKEFFSMLEGAIVLVGPTDPSLDELVPTPFDSKPVPRVSVYGNLLKTIYSGEYLHFPTPWKEAWITILLTSVLVAFGVFVGHRGHWVKGLIVLAFLAYIAGCFLAFSSYHSVWPMVVPVGAAISTTLLSLIIRVIYEERQKGRIQELFGAYVSPQIVKELVQQTEGPELGGADVIITSLFSDIQNFSSFSEKLAPGEVVKLMNEYFEAMTIILHNEGGTLDKYIGDAVIAMFGAPLRVPDHALHACIAAVLMQRRQKELNLMWSRQGDRWPEAVHYMMTRIGLSTGTATVGNMGSHIRFNYTMMGDTVNLASRAEFAAKIYGAPIVVTEDTYNAVSPRESSLLFRHLDRAVLPGRHQAVDLYELMGFKDELGPQVEECVELYEKGLQAYQVQNWKEALRYVEASQKLELLPVNPSQGVLRNPSSVLRERILVYEKNTPTPWNGVSIFASK